MKKLFGIIVLRKSYLLILLAGTLFIMNMIIWNEVSYINENYSNIGWLREHRNEDKYYLRYMPNATEDGLIINYTLQEKQEINQFLNDSLVNKHHGYYSTRNNQSFAPGGYDGMVSIPIDESYLNQLVFSIDIHVILGTNIIVVSAINQEQVAQFEKEASAIGFNAELVSFNDLYSQQLGYFTSTTLTVIGVALILGGFSVLLVYLIVRLSLKRNKQKIASLIETGRSTKNITRGFILVLIPVVLMTLIYSLWYQSTFSRTLVLYDFMYLSILNLIILLISAMIINKSTNKQLNFIQKKDD